MIQKFISEYGFLSSYKFYIRITESLWCGENISFDGKSRRINFVKFKD